MTPEQIKLVKESFALVVPIAEDAGELFYNRLMEVEPSLVPMFPNGAREQGRHLMQAVTIVVHGLDHFEKLVPAIEALGARHLGYGVTKEHFTLGGEVLLWTLEQGLGAAFTPAVREAWATAYGALVATMQNGADKAQAAARAPLAKAA
jgi:hemoglobin-like flavoprotein